MEYGVDEEILESDIRILATEEVEDISKKENEDYPSDNIGKYPHNT